MTQEEIIFPIYVGFFGLSWSEFQRENRKQRTFSVRTLFSFILLLVLSSYLSVLLARRALRVSPSLRLFRSGIRRLFRSVIVFFLSLVFLGFGFVGGAMLKKKMKRVVVDSSPSYAVDEEAKMRLKHQSLTQEYEELHKEADAMKKRLERTKKNKQTLLAEVRFLRRRYKHLLKNQSPNHQPEHNLEIRNKIPARERNYSGKEAAKRNPSPVLDLNQISRGEGDEEEEFQVNLEPLRMEIKPKTSLINNGRDEQINDLKLSICRDIGNGSNRTGKRKISWQDQLALRV